MLPAYDRTFYETVRSDMTLVDELTVPPRDGRAFDVPADHLFRIVNAEGSQVGDLNLWNAANLSERFYSGKMRALHATHVSTGDRLWSSLPSLRPMATITHDTLDWYGVDAFGARRPRRDRYPLHSLHQSPLDGRGLSLLLSFKPHPRPGRGEGPAAGRGGNARARRADMAAVTGSIEGGLISRSCPPWSEPRRGYTSEIQPG